MTQKRTRIGGLALMVAGMGLMVWSAGEGGMPAETTRDIGWVVGIWLFLAGTALYLTEWVAQKLRERWPR